MNLKFAFQFAALAIPAAAVLTAPADKVAFAPAPGTALARQWNIEMELTLDEQRMSMGGKPMPVELDMQMDLSMSLDLALHDELVEVEGGAPKLLRRRFDKAASNASFAMEVMGQQNERNVTGASELQGKTVEYRAKDGGGYEVAFHESEGDAKLLEKLEEDMDLRGFLPSEPVVEGATWKPDPNAFLRVLSPGGNLSVKPNLDDDERDAMGSMGFGMEGFQDASSLAGETIEGVVEATYKGSREIDGRAVGEIRLTFKLESASDATETMREMFAKAPEEMGEFEIDHMDIEFAYEGEATLLWDLAGGYAHSFEMTGDVGLEQDIGMQITAQGRTMDIESNSTLSGTMSHKVAVAKE